MGERRRRIEIGHDHRRGRHLALPQLDAGHRTALDDDARHLDVPPELTAVLFEQAGQVIRDGAQAAAHL
jgi:hypothetical protein